MFLGVVTTVPELSDALPFGDWISKHIRDGYPTTSVSAWRKEHLAFHRDEILEKSGRKYHVIVRHE